jgi:hypothetical protein
MRLVLLHYHILKNGGSSIIDILARSFWERFAEYDLPGRDAEITRPDLLSFLDSNPGVQAFSSHQIFYPVPGAPGYLFFDICFLRDPIDRIRSTYDFFRVKPVPGVLISDIANQYTLGEFTRRLVEEMPWTVNDVQVNLLANGLVHDQPRGIEDLAVATARMLETSFLGVVDQFDESLVAGQYGLRTLFPMLNCVHAPVNVSAAPGSTLAERTEQFHSACDEAVFAELLRLNAMDFELLDRARAEVRRRFDLVPDGKERLRLLNQGLSKVPPPNSTKRHARSTPPASGPEPGILTTVTRGLRFAANVRMIRPGSAFRLIFDANYYRESYPDVAASGVDPIWHFVVKGAFEGRNPHPLFDTSFYLNQCPRPARINALADYLEHGEAAGRRPHPLFDPEFYAHRYPDVGHARMNALLHYVLHGAAERRKPHPLFEPDYYRSVCADARNAGNPLVHFLQCEAAECCNPHPLFDCRSYLAAHPDASRNPLVHYLTSRAGSPSPCEANAATFGASRFTFQDVEVLAVLSDSGFDACVETALVWRDAAGEKKFRCPPQQQPFFESLRYDQIAAQINGKAASGNL